MLERRTPIELPKKFQPLLGVKARYKGFWGGRGSAKSHSLGEALLLEAAVKTHRVLCVREIQRSIKESVKRLLDDKIVKLGLQHMYYSTEKSITCSATGSWFGFEGLWNNRDTIRSYEGITRVWNEEAHTTSQSSLETLIPTIRAPGSELWFSWNPRSPDDPVDSMFRGPGANEVIPEEFRRDYDTWMIAQPVSIEDNPWFPDVLRAEMEWDKRRDPERYAHVWLGEYVRMSSARVFRNWRIDTAEKAGLVLTEHMAPLYGADWGFSISPTALVRIYVFPEIRTIYIEAEAVKVGCPIDETPALFDSLPPAPNGGFSPRKTAVMSDSSRPETIDYMKKNGFPQMKGARKGAGSVEEGVEFLKSYDIIVHPNCPVCIRELTLYSFEVDKHTNAVLPKLADEHNHVIDAIRYAVEDLRRTPAIASPIVLTQPRTYFGDYVAGADYAP